MRLAVVRAAAQIVLLIVLVVLIASSVLCAAVLAVAVVSAFERAARLGCHVYFPSGERPQVFENHAVVHYFPVPRHVAPPHLVGYDAYALVAVDYRLVVGHAPDEPFECAPVVAEMYRRCIYRQFLRAHLQVVGLYYLVGIVYVEAVARHDGEMVPQFVLEAVHVTQIWVHIPHTVDYGAGAAVALGAVFDGHGQFYHVLYVTPVFRHDKFGAGREFKSFAHCVIMFFFCVVV